MNTNIFRPNNINNWLLSQLLSQTSTVVLTSPTLRTGFSFLDNIMQERKGTHEANKQDHWFS